MALRNILGQAVHGCGILIFARFWKTQASLWQLASVLQRLTHLASGFCSCRYVPVPLYPSPIPIPISCRSWPPAWVKQNTNATTTAVAGQDTGDGGGSTSAIVLARGLFAATAAPPSTAAAGPQVTNNSVKPPIPARVHACRSACHRRQFFPVKPPRSAGWAAAAAA